LIPRPAAGICLIMDENSPQSRANGMAAVWLPWLVAPLFMAAPIGGCAVAGRWRPAVACAVADGQSAADVSPPAGPAGAVVAVERR
jgi:hypothetical protein